MERRKKQKIRKKNKSSWGTLVIMGVDGLRRYSGPAPDSQRGKLGDPPSSMDVA